MKRWVTLAVAASMLVVVGCGSSGSDKAEVKGVGKDEACTQVQSLQADGQKMTEDVAAGKLPMGEMMAKTGDLAGRVSALSVAVEAGPLQDAIKQWANATTTQLSDPTPANQTTTYDARDKVDDLCDLPHGPRS